MSQINTVRKEGGSRVLAVSYFVPKEWAMVKYEIIKKTKETVTVKISKVK